MRAPDLAILWMLISGSTAQELLWQVHPVLAREYYNHLADHFGDLNRDGYDDVLCAALLGLGTLNERQVVRVLSGRDGAVMHEYQTQTQIGGLVGVGDFDRDGFPDFCVQWGWPNLWFLEVRSPYLNAPLLSITNPPGHDITGDLDVNGDACPDLLMSTYDQQGSTIRAIDRTGTTLWTIDATARGLVARSTAGVGDLDGDGADDFVVGATEFGEQRGAVILMSGRTATPLRYHAGPHPFALLGYEVKGAGDMDGDGVTDYAAGNEFGFLPRVVLAWSGATGVTIGSWSATVPGYLSAKLLCGRDVDLDGLADITSPVGGYPNVPNTPSLGGRVRTFSARDGQDLVHIATNTPVTQFGTYKADLGAQPGNPYPVVALWDLPQATQLGEWPRIRAFRLSPAGTRLVGTGCSSSTTPPTIGIRRTDGATSDGTRIVLGSAPPTALAFCLFAFAAEQSANGVTVPYPLDPAGLPGCTMLVPPGIVATRVTDRSTAGRGYAAVDLPRALALTTTGGTNFAAQWVVLDPATLGYAATARHEFRLQ